jgi:hypothetical protein
LQPHVDRLTHSFRLLRSVLASQPAPTCPLIHGYRDNNTAVSTRSISAGMAVEVRYHNRTVSQQGLQSPSQLSKFTIRVCCTSLTAQAISFSGLLCRIFTSWIARIRLPYDGEEDQEAERAMQSEGVTTRLIIQQRTSVLIPTIFGCRVSEIIHFVTSTWFKSPLPTVW